MAFYYKRGKYFWVSFTEGGKRLRKSLKTDDGKKITDEKTAKYFTNVIENTVSRGQSPIPIHNALMSKVLEEYKQYSTGIKALKTVNNEYGTLDFFIKKTGIGFIGQINEKKIRDYLDGRIEKNEINHITANNYIKYLNTFLNFAVRRNYLSQNPLAGIKHYKVDHETIPRFLSLEETERLIKSAEGETLYPVVMIAIYTGMRLGEIRRLVWDDIKMNKEIVLVKKSKSGRARSIPIHSNLKKILTESIFPLNFTNHLRVFKRIRRIAKLTDIDWKTTRHTFASHLVMEGVDIVTVAKLLGHSKISTTMIYAHLSQDHMKDSIKRLVF